MRWCIYHNIAQILNLINNEIILNMIVRHEDIISNIFILSFTYLISFGLNKPILLTVFRLLGKELYSIPNTFMKQTIVSESFGCVVYIRFIFISCIIRMNCTYTRHS